MNAVKFYLQRILRILGWPGLLGVILLLLAALLTVAVIQPKKAQLAELRQENRSLKIRIAQTARTGIPATGNQNDLARFYRFFSGTPTTIWLQKLYAAAGAQNLLLERGEYRMSMDPGNQLLRYQINLPVKGTYLQIRGFLAQALTDVPVAALDDISFKRETIDATQLEAQIKLTLFLSADSMGKL